MATILLLGAGGFVGRHVSEALRRTPGLEVVESVREAGERARRPHGLGIDLVAADIRAVRRMVAGVNPTVIVNCAGRTTGPTTQLVEANVLIVSKLLDALGLAGDQVRVVHIGSAAEYGRGPVGEPVTEKAAARPVSPYGVSKLAATRLVTLARDRGQIDGVVLRLFNPIGPGMAADTLPGSVTDKLAGAMAGGLAAIETGPLGAVRDFVDVRDVGRAVAAACIARELPEPIVNIGSGTGHAARDLVQELARCFGYEGRISEGSEGSARSDRVAWQVADITVARNTLGWEPIHDLADSCEFVVRGDSPRLTS